MSRPWKIPIIAVALTLTAAGLPAATAAPPADPPRARISATGAGRPAWITLVTGDRLAVTSRPGKPPQIRFEPHPRSGSDAAVTQHADGHTYVIPSAAAADVRSGRLDRSLFDVTTLLAEGRDDARSKTLPVIVRYGGTPKNATATARGTTLAGSAKSRLLTSIGARAEAVDKARAEDFWAALTGRSDRVAGTVARVTLDRRVGTVLDRSVPQLGAPAAWQRGLTGKGVKIAILDTGIDATHPDLAGRVVAAANFSESAESTDRHGHGTHVAGIAAGTGAASDGRHRGVAPDAELLNGKVLSDDGFGFSSGIIAGMEWAVEQGATVVNLSLGGEPGDGTDELSSALNRLSRTSGATFVVAAGNCPGPDANAVSSPGAADEAVAVGGLERDGTLADFSCRGPRLRDGVLKPQLSAPGAGIVAPRAAGTELGNPVDEHYTAASGTSMATPHVAGVAALIAQANPAWRNDQIRQRLIATADPQQSRPDEEGAGRVDADQATAAEAVGTDATELNLGTLRWPHPAEDEVSRELTYPNSGDTPATVALAASGGTAVRLNATELTIPAKGSAKVTLTVDRAAGGVGTFSGRVTATAPGADPLVTPFGWVAEEELYDLTVRGISRFGEPVDGDELNVLRMDGEPVGVPRPLRILRNGTATLRLPPGKYVVSAIFVFDATDERHEGYDLVATAELDHRAPGEVGLDARTAKPVDIAPKGRKGVVSRSQHASFDLVNSTRTAAGGVGISWAGTPQLGAATPTGRITTGQAEFTLAARYETPPYELTVDGEPLEVRDFRTGPRTTGHWQVPVADGGSGRPEELTDVKGRLAVLGWSWPNPQQWLPGDLVKAAQDAGAIGALVYNRDVPGLGGLRGYWGMSSPGEVTIPAMRTARATARALLARGPVTVDLIARDRSPVVYDLSQSWPGRVPAPGRVQVPSSELAVVRELFGAHEDPVSSSAERVAVTPQGNLPSSWFYSPARTPAERTAYVQTTTAKWQSDYIYANYDSEGVGFSSQERRFRAKEQVRERWLGPVLLSGIPAQPRWQHAANWVDDRWLKIHLSSYQNGQLAALYGYNPRLTLERNGEVLGTVEDNGLFADLPDDPADFRVTLESTETEARTWKYSTRVRATWAWKSKGGKQEVMPLIFADLDLPTADLLSRVPVGKPVPLTLRLRHHTGSTGSAFTGASLEVSYDGTTWTKVPLIGAGSAKYRADITHPAGAAGKAPAYRLKVTDAAGGSMEQEVTDAHGLK